MAKDFERPFTVSVRSASCGATAAKDTQDTPSYRMCSYISSLMIQRLGWRSSTAARLRYSTAE